MGVRVEVCRQGRCHYTSASPCRGCMTGNDGPALLPLAHTASRGDYTLLTL
eukprot:COSAG05_NODE_28_length_29121_cov_56.951933_17_plen_51_part_00